MTGSLAAFERMEEKPMTCEEFVDSLAAFRDGDMRAADRVRTQEHLASCDKCSAYLHGYERTIELAKRTASVNRLSPGLPDNLVHRIMAARRRS